MIIKKQLLTAEKFQQFGDIITLKEQEDFIINNGRCKRYHDLCQVTHSGDEGKIGISLFDSQKITLPFQLSLVERHPLGSQAFIPMHNEPFLIVVAEDNHGVPSTPVAFITEVQQGINFHQNIWHGPLMPLGSNGLFAVVDRIGKGNNLEEYTYPTDFTIT